MLANVDAELAGTLAARGAVPRYVGARLGAVKTAEGEAIEVDVTMETMPSVLFDALIVPGPWPGTVTTSAPWIRPRFDP